VLVRHGRRPFVRSSLLAASVFLVGGAAYAEQRPRSGSDSSSAARSAARDAAVPEVVFLARLGRTWELARMGTQDIPATRPGAAARRPGRHPGPGSRPTIRVTADPVAPMPGDSGTSHAGGWSFCNGYGAAYELGPGDRLRFRLLQSTLVGCDGPDSLETRCFRALARTRRFELDSATLSLVAEDGSRLTFLASPEVVEPPSN